MPAFLTFRSVGALAALLLLGACSGARTGGAEANPPPAEAAAADVTAFLAEVLGGPPALAYADLVARLGPPVRVHAEAAAGASGAAPADTLRTVVYYGLEVVLHEASSLPASHLARVALTDARHTAPDGLRVGYAHEHILRALGRPTRQAATELFYEQTDPRPHLLLILLERRVASRIEWRFDGE